MANIGHNSTHEQLKGFVAQYVKCDEQSTVLNDKRNEIRGKAEELGIPSKAFQDSVSRAKADRKKKEGYDEGMKTMREVLGDINQDDLFAYLDRREEEKEKAREARAKEKAKEEEFKPADKRKPKNGKNIGKEQAAAYNKAHAN